MRTVVIHKAQPVHGCDAPVEGVAIVIDTPMPDLPLSGWSGRARDFHHDQAQALADELWRVLPGGTLDALVGVLMAERARLYRVPMPRPRARRAAAAWRAFTRALRAVVAGTVDTLRRAV